MENRALITKEFLDKKGFSFYKLIAGTTFFIRDKMIFEFGTINAPILRRKIDGNNSQFLAEVKYWEDVYKYWDEPMEFEDLENNPITEEQICHYFYYIGAADGVSNVFSKDAFDHSKFKKRYKEFKENK